VGKANKITTFNHMKLQNKSGRGLGYSKKKHLFVGMESKNS